MKVKTVLFLIIVPKSNYSLFLCVAYICFWISKNLDYGKQQTIEWWPSRLAWVLPFHHQWIWHCNEVTLEVYLCESNIAYPIMYWDFRCFNWDTDCVLLTARIDCISKRERTNNKIKETFFKTKISTWRGLQHIQSTILSVHWCAPSVSQSKHLALLFQASSLSSNESDQKLKIKRIFF